MAARPQQGSALLPASVEGPPRQGRRVGSRCGVSGGAKNRQRSRCARWHLRARAARRPGGRAAAATIHARRRAWKEGPATARVRRSRSTAAAAAGPHSAPGLGKRRRNGGWQLGRGANWTRRWVDVRCAQHLFTIATRQSARRGTTAARRRGRLGRRLLQVGHRLTARPWVWMGRGRRGQRRRAVRSRMLR